MIEAANRIRHRPYVWGGGHRHWNSRGYDCSGSVSYVMHAAGLLESPLDSTGFMRWGGGGGGSWVRIYANKEHVFAVIAGLRWDTSFSEDGDRSGPGWSEQMRPDRRLPPAPPARPAQRHAARLAASVSPHQECGQTRLRRQRDKPPAPSFVRRYKGAIGEPLLGSVLLFSRD